MIMQYTCIFMTEKELLKYVTDRTPALRILLEKYWNISLFDYAKEKYTIIQPTERKKYFLAFLSSYIIKKFNTELATLVTTSLDNNYCVSTADHHGPAGHPFWFQSGILRGLVRPDEAIVNLCTSHVSLGNSSYPRGFVMQSDTCHIPHLQLPFFPASARMSPVFGYPAFREENVTQSCLSQLKKHTREWHISDEKYNIIRSWIEKNLLNEKILQCKTYSEQITLINHQLWGDIFGDTLPPLITLDGEDIVREILMSHLEDGVGFTEMLTNEALQSTIEEQFDGISCCFERKALRGTYFFWYLDENHERHALWRTGSMLCTSDGSINIKMNRECLTEALKTKKLIPSGLLMYTTLAGYYGLKCFGGFAQWDYLPQVLKAYSSFVEESYLPHESILCEDMVFSFTKNWAISTALNMLSDKELSHREKLLTEARNTTLSASICAMIPELARCLPR